MDPFDATVCFYCADQNPHRDRSRGITAYTEALMCHLQLLGVKLEAVVSKSSFPIPANIRRWELPFRTDGGPGRLVADHLHPFFPSARKKGVSRLWHYPKGFLPLFGSRRMPRVGTIADMILPFYADKYPASRPRSAFAYWFKVLKHSVENFDVILTVSDFSAAAIGEFARRHGLRCPPVINTYEGVNEPLIEPAGCPKENAVIHLASALPHKGTVWLLEKWRQLQKSGADLPVLVLVGGLDAEAQGLLATLRHARVQAPLPRPELERLIAGARALLLPSEIEGFGLPAVEAYFCGTPTAYVRGTAVEEVLGAGTTGAFELEAGPDSLRQAMTELFAMTADEIGAKAAALRHRYDWGLCAARTVAAYQTII